VNSKYRWRPKRAPPGRHGVQTAYISPEGNFAGDADMKADSTTDGADSTPDANHRWPDVLARRLVQAGDAPIAVLKRGDLRKPACFSDRMGALACFDRDVLSHPHADTVILMIGINDIGWPGCILAPQEPAPSADAIIDGYKQLIARAHFHGMRINRRVRHPVRQDPKWTTRTGSTTR
jgi:lysophospholipase L1-like esterase